MEAALLDRLADHAGLLQEVRLDVGAGDVPARVEVDANELALGRGERGKKEVKIRAFINEIRVVIL